MASTDCLHFLKYDGFTSDDFFYIKEKGRRKFYSRITGKPTTMYRIPPKLVDDIKERCKHVSVKNITNERKDLELKLNSITQRIKEIDEQLSNTSTMQEQLEEEKLLQHSANQRKKQADIDFMKYMEELMKYENKTREINVSEKSSNLLKKLGIKNKHDYYNWLLINHPDKGGKDIALCRNVISEFQKYYQ